LKGEPSKTNQNIHKSVQRLYVKNWDDSLKLTPKTLNINGWKMKFVFWGVGLLGALAVFFQGVQGYKRVLILRQTGMRENSMAVQNPPPNIGSKASESEI